MTAEELQDLKDRYPARLAIWYGMMLSMEQAKLVETLLYHMPQHVLETSLQNIPPRREDDGSNETTK